MARPKHNNLHNNNYFPHHQLEDREVYQQAPPSKRISASTLLTILSSLGGLSLALIALFLLPAGPLAQFLLFTGFLLSILPPLLHIFHTSIDKQEHPVGDAWKSTQRWRWLAAVGISAGVTTVIAPTFLPRLLPATASFFAGTGAYSAAALLLLGCLAVGSLAWHVNAKVKENTHEVKSAFYTYRYGFLGMAYTMGFLSTATAAIAIVVLVDPFKEITFLHTFLAGSIGSVNQLFLVFGALFAAAVTIGHLLHIRHHIQQSTPDFGLTKFRDLQKTALNKMGTPLKVFSLSLAFVVGGAAIACIALYLAPPSTSVASFFAETAAAGLSTGTLFVAGAIALLVAIPVLHIAHVLSQAPLEPGSDSEEEEQVFTLGSVGVPRDQHTKNVLHEHGANNQSVRSYTREGQPISHPLDDSDDAFAGTEEFTARTPTPGGCFQQ